VEIALLGLACEKKRRRLRWFDWPLMREWTERAVAEPAEITDLDVAF
jgi:hypothetical protein